MNIQILDSHLREFLKTTATPQKIAELLSLCGPSVDHLTKFGKNDWVYDIEITTNRVDSASVVGIAREASAILPQFGIKAELKNIETKAKNLATKDLLPLTVKPDTKLNKRVMAVVLEITQNETPQWMVDRLEASGMRSKNILVDITNYIMLEVGHPTHVFDYDKIDDHFLGFRLSGKGETAVSFDKKKYVLPGNDIVIASKSGEIIDLPGIIGTANSVVSDKTKRIIYFIDNNDPALMRKTSLALNIRTVAVQLNEKSVDPELGKTALLRGLELYINLASGKPESKIYDFYPNPYKAKTMTISVDLINQKIGVEIPPTKILSILKSLGFSATISKQEIKVTVPSFRAHEVDIAEDLIEEIARIYGYSNLPSVIMPGELPLEKTDPVFEFENNIKDILSGLGGVEVYTLSLVSREMTGAKSLRVKNPLGTDTEYLRTTLENSLIQAAKTNAGNTKPFHLFELANVYIANKNGLPEEKAMMAGVFSNFDFRAAKGILEALFVSLNIKHPVTLKIVDQHYYYEFEVLELLNCKKPKTYKPISKYPPQIEDMTIVIPQEKSVSEIIQSIKQASKLVQSVELVDVFEQKYTFRISYHDSSKTLSDKEVEEARNAIEKATAS